MTTKLTIEGMHCDACVRRVRKVLESAGAKPVGDVTIGAATLEGSAEDAAAVVAKLTQAGYPTQITG